MGKVVLFTIDLFYTKCMKFAHTNENKSLYIDIFPLKKDLL